jgi:hypothetical protein
MNESFQIQPLEKRLLMTLLAYEGFDYTQSVGASINGLNGGAGWTNAFVASGPSLSSGLTFPGVTSVGKAGAYTAGSQTYGVNTLGGGRHWGPVDAPPAAGTYWYSLLLNPSGSNPRGTIAVFGKPTDVQNGFGLRIDTDAGAVTLKAWSPHQAAGSSIPLNSNQTYFVLGRTVINVDGTSTNTVWVNPDFSSEPLSGGSSVSAPAASTAEVRRTLTGRSFTNATGPVVDEIRIGATFSDVVPIVPASNISEQIIVNQIGYRATGGRKVVVFANPVVGYNSANAYIPGATFQVRRSSDNVPVFNGNVVSWKNGLTDPESGDQAWHGDFTSLTTPGEYYVYDPINDKRSFSFLIGNDVNNGVMQASVRSFYYQRVNQAKAAQHAGSWTHALDHSGPNQDTQARLFINGAVDMTAPVLDLRGGWFDAGDYNKYVPFLSTTLWNLMNAYETSPGAFPDNYNIPESGNGVPDLLDEVKYTLDFLLRMQRPDGGVLNRVSNSVSGAGNADPVTNTQARYYTQATTWATATMAAAAAQGSRIFAAFEPVYPGYAQTLLAAAERAWGYLQSKPAMFPANGEDGGGTGATPGNLASAAAGSNAGDDQNRRVLAAAELLKTTGNATYKMWFEANYNKPNGGHHPLLGSKQFDGILAQQLNHAFVTYATTSGANASIVNEIRSSLRKTADTILLSAATNQTDPYRAFMWSGHYTWGSNQYKSQWAALLLSAIRIGVDPAKNAQYRELAEEYVHYYLGRNPLSFVYLTNLGPKGANLGAEKSIMEIWHYWFADGSAKYDGLNSLYGPAPGYLSGGPNQFYNAGITPPDGQPALKSYLDWNKSWPDKAWEITEPAIYYQAAFTMLLSAFVQDSYKPRVIGASLDTSTARHRFEVTFNEDVGPSLTRSDFVLTNQTTGQLVASSNLNLTYDASVRRAALEYTPGTLPDGRYRLELAASAASDSSANTLEAPLLFESFFLAGDANRDGAVDFDDLLILASNYGSSGRTYAQGNFDYSPGGTVNFDDLLVLASRYGVSLFPAASLQIGSSRIADDILR